MTFEKFLISIDTLFYGYLIGRMIPSMIFFGTGLYLKDTNWSPKFFPNKYVLLLIIIFVFMPVYNNALGVNDNDYGYSYVLYSFVAILSTILLIVISSKLSCNLFIETISKGTLVVLGVHFSLLKVIDYLLSHNFDYLYPFIIILICYYIILLCDKYCAFLLGKWTFFERYFKIARNT